jgi:hypothetical protein
MNLQVYFKSYASSGVSQASETISGKKGHDFNVRWVQNFFASILFFSQEKFRYGKNELHLRLYAAFI